ncbi:hypothetical protein MMC28_007676 [Mycoblastus sanguinarius]|nr:hypothetical protein [Mycoblastus sanguinarius]
MRLDVYLFSFLTFSLSGLARPQRIVESKTLAERADADEEVDHAWVAFDERSSEDADEQVDHAWVEFQG